MSCRRTFASEKERLLLIDLVDKKKHIINDSRNQSSVNMQKHIAWEEITRQFNAAELGPAKSIKQIRKIWEKIKGRAKREQDLQKVQRMKTAQTSASTHPGLDNPGVDSVVVISPSRNFHGLNAGCPELRTDVQDLRVKSKNEEVTSGSSLVSDITSAFEENTPAVVSSVPAHKIQRKHTTASRCPEVTEARYMQFQKLQQEHELKMQVVNEELAVAKHSKLAYEQWERVGQEIQKATRDIQEASQALKEASMGWLKGLHNIEEALNFFIAFFKAYKK
ncbi:uncharacterized protein LOC143031252 [Oratosquilla oratoria]|uniref:uncharacterized protein LOC143031252 n=1 Tax=Oratosquilla oratoria TaxID=337810 RepID=UPI003F75AD03